jgi:hypothetical protein
VAVNFGNHGRSTTSSAASLTLLGTTPPRFPSLRCIKLWGCDHISFATRVGRDQVRLGAMAPDLRAVGITLCDEADLPWVEEWDDE